MSKSKQIEVSLFGNHSFSLPLFVVMFVGVVTIGVGIVLLAFELYTFGQRALVVVEVAVATKHCNWADGRTSEERANCLHERLR